MANRIQLRRGTAAEWTAANPVLGDGEPGVEKDTGKVKYGNGAATWTALPYASAGPQGPAGVVDDTSVADLVTTPGTETATALSATYATKDDLGSMGGIYVIVGAIEGDAGPEINAKLQEVAAAGGGAVVLTPGHVYDIETTVILDSSMTVLDGNGATFRTTTNSALTLVDLEDPTALPQFTRPVLKVGGTMASRINQSGVRNLVIDGASNVATSGSFANLVLAHADNTTLDNVRSLNSATSMLNLQGNVNEGLCLLIEHSLNTLITGGDYSGSGYDAVRIAGGSVGTKLVGVGVGWAKRGAVQCTPGSNYTTFIGCNLDNMLGTTDVSHALYGHNTQNISVTGGTLKATAGRCLAIFGDGDLNRVGRSDGIKIMGTMLVHDGPASAMALWTEFVQNVDIDVTVTKTGTGGGYFQTYGVAANSIKNVRLRVRGTSTTTASAFDINNVEVFTLDTNTTSAATSQSHISVKNSKQVRIGGTLSQVNGQAVFLEGNSDVTVQGLVPTTGDGMWAIGTQQRIDVLDNNFLGITNANPLRVYGPATGRVRGNRKVITEKSASATITAAATSVTVTHGLWAGTATAGTPRTDRLWLPSDFQVSFAGNPGAAKAVWISAVTPTQVTFTVDAAPGADTTIVWSARMDRES